MSMKGVFGIKRCLIVSILILILSGCSTMAPSYKQPAAPVPSSWPKGAAYKETQTAAGENAAAGIIWQDFFVDSKLQKLIAMALENNRDLRIATLNIERSMAQYQIQRSALIPKIDASASGTFQRVPQDFSISGKSVTTHQYNVGLGLSSYELDLFGRVSNLKDQALEQYLATEQVRRGVQISLISQVAAAYLTLTSDCERLRIANETLTSQQASYKLIKSRFDAGISSALALSQARTTVDGARVDIARYTSLVAQDENALSLVIGAQVPVELMPQALSDILTALKDLPAGGLPSDVLLLRPDILQAENLLKGVNANIGAARAAFFPRITLASSVGFGSNELAGLFSGGSFAWSFIPKISFPLFDAGSNTANLKVAEVDRDIAVAQYEKAIQTAFREVADVLAQRGTINEQLAAQQSLSDASAESYRISLTRFEQGIDNYLTVLDAQRSLYIAQQGLIGVRLAKLNSLVTLYKVLGGGGI